MSSETPARPPGADWRVLVRKVGTSEFDDAFAASVTLEASVLDRPRIGVAAIASFFAATTDGMYDSLTFGNEVAAGAKTYIEWGGRHSEWTLPVSPS